MMNEIPKFDLLNSKLEGANLIEASAGTGKTYTITGLFLRLVVERKLSVEEILVVTFTEAATEELRDRIRTALRTAKETFSGKMADDEFFNEFARKYRSLEDAPRRLQNAIRDFDQASIFTIHGFCNRMLNENAFESGSLFDTELVTNIENLKQEIVQDFWRTYITHESPLFVNFAMQNNFNPPTLLSLVSSRIIQPDFKVIPQVEIPDSRPDESEFRKVFEELRSAWQTSKNEVANILFRSEHLNRSRYKKEQIPIWIDFMDDLMASDGNNPMLFEKFEKFTASEIESATKKNCPAPAHSFFDLCEKFKQSQERLQAIFEQRILGLKVKLFNFLRDELIKRKQEKNIQSFDDLLLTLYHVLQQPGGNALAQAIRKKFKAALIDEFQDTDPVQYAIFKNIFGYQHTILFLIGDPKQAIYGFRGADIFAYMDAAGHTTNRYTLSCNWRSEPGLITAINQLFSHATAPFIYTEIPFAPATAAEKPDRDYLKIDDLPESPFRIWYMNASKFNADDKVISKTTAREIIFQAVAAEISRLLNSSQQRRIRLGNRALKEQDIAVLVRRNSEAIMMQQALLELNIPSVLFSTNNLFDSDEAMECQRVLASIAEPNSDKLLKSALATAILGVTGEEIDSLLENETEWEAWHIKLKSYHEIWNRRGFIHMFRVFLSYEHVLPRLMAFPDGERRNTNMLHLAEVLHQVSAAQKLGMTDLLKWLSEQRDSRMPRLEEHQLRLESDENAVKLVTVHKSKGLEYPIVFCPFTWDGSKIKSSADYLIFHDENDDQKLTLDLGSEHQEENRTFAEQELLAENLRLLYVALTRAKHRCYFVWGRFNEAETSAPAYLFHQPRDANSDLIPATSAKVKEMTDEQLYSELRTIADGSNGTIRLDQLEREHGKKYIPERDLIGKLQFRPFAGRVASDWRISSYSSLVSRISYGAEIADYDIEDVSEKIKSEIITGEITKSPARLMGFPGGARAGIFFHKIFESIDFETPSQEIVSQKLKQYGFDDHWEADVFQMIQNVLAMPLDPNDQNFTLSKIKTSSRISELEFYFPLKMITPGKLAEIFRNDATSKLITQFPERMERLDFAPMRGYMKGFIDLVFQHENRYYLVDWKSNLLGERLEDYGQNQLRDIMEKEFYFLQYHIYTVALNAYLKHRLPDYRYEEHFGGVCYLFLRGIAPQEGPAFGIYRDRPSAKLINELVNELIDRAFSES